MHRDIRELGKGRYSHWTQSTLYFSASDSTDPRTNGRKYELVSSEEYISQRAKCVAGTGNSSLVIRTNEKARIRPVRL
ncbi:MAG: hypothetical protein QF437_33090, partial [Planctomycetota bacterium]|nr:hypothetical protein [Planctomycetota bacterium]